MAEHGDRFDIFETKPRIVLVFDPDQMDADSIERVTRLAVEVPKIPGFRGCLPCARSGFDFVSFESVVLPALRSMSFAAAAEGKLAKEG
jgi:hypothetical protein